MIDCIDQKRDRIGHEGNDTICPGVQQDARVCPFHCIWIRLVESNSSWEGHNSITAEQMEKLFKQSTSTVVGCFNLGSPRALDVSSLRYKSQSRVSL